MMEMQSNFLEQAVIPSVQMPSKLGSYSKRLLALESAPEMSEISRDLSGYFIWLLISLLA